MAAADSRGQASFTRAISASISIAVGSKVSVRLFMPGSTSLELFDPSAEPPTLLRPGDRVRFVVESVQTT